MNNQILIQKATHKQFLLINTKVGFTLDVRQLLCFGYISLVLRGMDAKFFCKLKLK